MAKTKLKGNKFAEAWAAHTDGGIDMIMHSRVLPTHFGRMFLEMLVNTAPHAYQASGQGARRMTPPELVDYCKRVTLLAQAELQNNAAFGLTIPGLQTVLDRLNMAAQDDAMDAALDRAFRDLRGGNEDEDDDNLLTKETKGNG